MEAEVRAEELRRDERILQAIDECISTKDDHYKRNTGILKEILEDVFTTIKGRDRFFREHFQGFFLDENYYKGPKTGKPEEFNVNISFKVSPDYEFITVERGELGYKMLKFYAQRLIDTSQLYKHSNFTREWTVYKGLKNSRTSYDLNKDVFRQSITSLLAWSILNIPRIDNYTIKVREDSPAFTLCINKQDVSEMKVNLMPLLEFYCRPPYSLQRCIKWYAVPEPLKGVKDQHLLWRMAFYNHENDLLTRHRYLTPTIRKLEVWTVISRYHIKTLFMHYARSMQNDLGCTTMCELTGMKLFIHMLDQLRNMCKTRYLENVWVRGHNLIDADEEQFVGITEKLTTMIKEITDDPTKVAHWILTSKELGMFQNELKAVEILQDTDRPSNGLRMSEDDGPGLSEDVRNTADGISKPVMDAIAASRDIESSLSTEAGNDKVRCPAEMDILRVIARLESSIETLSHRLTGLEQKSAVTV